MNIFSIFGFLILCFNLIYTFRVNLGVLHYETADPLRADIVKKADRTYKRNGSDPRIDFRQREISDILSANTTLCELTSSNGIIALVGPTYLPASPILQSICGNLEIPYLEYMWKPNGIQRNMTLNFYPENELLAKGIATLAAEMEWSSFTVLYEHTESLIKLKNVLKLNVRKDLPLVFKQLLPGADYRPLFKEIRNYTENTIILDCEFDNILPILNQAKEVKMLEYHNKYFITNLDAHTIDYRLLNTSANITTIALLNTSSPLLANEVKNWNDGRLNKITPEEVKIEDALLHDAIHFFVKNLYNLIKPGTAFPQQILHCNEREKLEKGFNMYQYMLLNTAFEGDTLTGTIKFNEHGQRIDFKLYAVEIDRSKKDVIAHWSPGMEQAHIYRNVSMQIESAVEGLKKVTVIVASKLVPPYLMEHTSEDGKNVTLEGFVYDLIEELAKRMEFKFKFEIHAEHGKYDPNIKGWTGLVRELLDRRAHMAIGDLTITEARRSMVDFSLPFMTLGISILHRKAQVSTDSNKFAFMEPFDFEVWVYTVTLYLIVSCVLYVIARFAPGDWENPHPCDPDPEELENIWDLKNCFWLTLGSIMTQGCDILPKGISSRMGASMWWFFSLIMTSSYTANLAAFLTKERMETTINTAEDLAKQTKIKYGTMLGGATMSFFKNSNFSTYARLWTNMEQAKPSVFEKENGDGVKRVLKTRDQLYAFFMESASIEYEVTRNCNLKLVGGRLDSKGYGIAMPMNSAYRSAVDQQILLLQELGKLSELKKKWWKDKVVPVETCDDDDGKEASTNELALDNVGGVFIVLSVGVAIAFLLAFAEFLWNVYQVSVEEHITYADALWLELKFAVKVWITKKRTKPVISDSTSNGSDTRSIAQRVMQAADSFIHLDVFDKISTTKKD